MTNNAGIAQLVEQLICNHQVPSSILGAGTIFDEQSRRTVIDLESITRSGRWMPTYYSRLILS